MIVVSVFLTYRLVSLFQFALKQKFLSGEKKDHWLDHAKNKYDSEFIQDIKDVMRVLLLYLPVPMVWALYHQQVI